LMRLYAAMGRPTLAAEQFENCMDLLQTELGIGPDESTISLYHQLGLESYGKGHGEPEEAGRKKPGHRAGKIPVEPLSADPLREARLLLAKGESMALEGESAEGLALLEKALKIYERFGGVAAKARLILGEAMLWLSVPLRPVMGQTLRQKAIGHLKGAAEYYRQNGLSFELARTLLLLAAACWNEGNNGEAAAVAREGLELARRLGDQETEGVLATLLGMALRELFRLAEARAAFARAVEAMPGLTNAWYIQWLLFQRGILSYITGDLAEAEGFLREAMALNKSIAFPGLQAKIGECMIRNMFLVVFHHQDRRAEMAEYVIPPNMEKYNPESFVYLDPLFYRAKDPAAILPDLAEWLRVRFYRLSQPMLACTIRVVVEEMLAAGMTEEAARWAAVGIRQARVRGWQAIQALFYAHRAVALARLGRLGEAERCRWRAEEYVEEIDRWAPAWLARADGAIARARGDRAEAARCFAQSIRLFKQMGAIY
ncbi:MAG: bacterial transcriptional activator domain-containing protein, partial [Firmicutes bacterium]|nr:bacterial transcriptional activator domain-containing protein [Bacillota bacterium]